MLNLFKKKVTVSYENCRNYRDQSLQLSREATQAEKDGEKKLAKILRKRAELMMKIAARGYAYSGELNY